MTQGTHSESRGGIFVFAASKMEADPLARRLGVSRWDSSSQAGPIAAGPNQLTFFITGIGPKLAGKRASEILLSASRPARDQQNEKPDAAIVIGVCGGLTELLPETTIVTYSSCLSTINEATFCPCAPQLYAQITALLNAQNVPCRSVIGITSPRVAINKDDKLRLARSGAQVVDMESYDILLAAQECGVPAAVVRVVSDSLDRRLPDFNRALNPDGSVNNRKALRVMLGSPLLTARAFTANKRAARHLANTLSVVLSADFPCFQ
jgi:nucleoside phosphorylase